MKKYLFALHIFFVLNGLDARASHIVGADMSMECIGNNDYAFYLNVYYDCAAPGFAPLLALDLYQGSTYHSSIGLSTDTSNAVQITPFCTPLIGMCFFKTLTYADTVTITDTSSNWVACWTECCRGWIPNLNQSSSEGRSIKLMFNNVNGCNGSPQFTTPPILFACCNQSFGYDQGAMDPESDSLVYSLYHANTDGSCADTTVIVYGAGFGPTNFFTSGSTIAIDAQTGILNMEPTNCSEGSVYGVEVREYDNGDLIGSIQRDVAIWLYDSTISNGIWETQREEISIFPNPASNIIVIKGVQKKDKIEILSVSGSLVKSLSYAGSIDVGDLVTGLYIVRVYHSNGRTQATRLLVK